MAAPIDQIRAKLGNPVSKLNAHESICFQQGDVENALTVSFKRTIRVPEDGSLYDLPPNLGYFPLYNIAHYKSTLPKGMVAKGGVFMPIHEREAIWISFESTRPFAVKVYLGGINAISGEPLLETLATHMRRSQRLQDKEGIQDYAVVEPVNEGQLWLDGVAKDDGKVMQFVAVPSGAGYSVEARIMHIEAVGGIQISATPIKCGTLVNLTVEHLGIPPFTLRTHSNATVHELMVMISEKTGIPEEQFCVLFKNKRLEKNRLLSHYNITTGCTIHMRLKLQGGGVITNRNLPSPGEMSIAAGGLIKQAILRDPHAADVWDTKNVAMINVQLFNANLFQRVTGMVPHPSPVTAETYAAAGLPFYSLPEEPKGGIYGNFSDVKSITKIDVEKGKQGLDKELKFPVVQLNKTGNVAFQSLGHMVAQLKKLGFYVE